MGRIGDLAPREGKTSDTSGSVIEFSPVQISDSTGGSATRDDTGLLILLGIAFHGMYRHCISDFVRKASLARSRGTLGLSGFGKWPAPRLSLSTSDYGRK
jgi:hypothetical protein